MEKVSIKEWYLEQYPTDELGLEINDNSTFMGLFEQMDNYRDVYGYIGVHDSLVRERVFEKLSMIMGVEYDYVYEQWLKTA